MDPRSFQNTAQHCMYICIYIYIYIYIQCCALFRHRAYWSMLPWMCHSGSSGGSFNRPFRGLWANFHTKGPKRVSLRCPFWCLWRHFGKKDAKRVRCLKIIPNWRKPDEKLTLFGVIFGRIFCKSMLKMWLGTAAATGVCFIGSWTAPTLKKWHTKPRKAAKSLEGCSKSHFGWKREKPENWCTEVCVGQLWESFLRPGGHTNLKKTVFIDTVFSVVF